MIEVKENNPDRRFRDIATVGAGDGGYQPLIISSIRLFGEVVGDLWMITKAEIDWIHDMDKVMEADWEWIRRGPNYEGEAKVYCLNEDINLLLKGWKREAYGFCLLYKTSRIIRRWDNITPHTNPDGEVIDGPHKHYWDGNHEDGFAYAVDDVATNDVDRAFQDFLEEESIEHTGSYIRQEELPK